MAGETRRKKELERKRRGDEDHPYNPTVYSPCSGTTETVESE